MGLWVRKVVVSQHGFMGKEGGGFHGFMGKEGGGFPTWVYG